MGYVHAHLIVTDDGLVLVDTGLPRRSARIGKALYDLRRKVGEVGTILMTHHHADHTGGLAEIKRRSGATVVANEADAAFIDGSRVVETSGVLRVVSWIMGTPQPASVDEKLTGDGPTRVPGITAIHTPGHTAGHMSYLLDRSGGVLFAGDAAGGGLGRLRTAPRMVTFDEAEQTRSIAKLGALEFETAVFGHGPAVRGRAVERFRAYAG